MEFKNKTKDAHACVLGRIGRQCEDWSQAGWNVMEGCGSINNVPFWQGPHKMLIIYKCHALRIPSLQDCELNKPLFFVNFLISGILLLLLLSEFSAVRTP
jgi:hypothetical protein